MTSKTLPVLLGPMLFSLAAYGADKPATCELSRESLIGRSSASLPQVSNMGSIQVRCSVPARPFPSVPGESRPPLRVTTTSYQLSPGGKKELVASQVNQSGGGTDDGGEYVVFSVHIPLEPAEADAEARRFLAKFIETTKTMPSASSFPTEEAQKQALERVRELMYQHRVGHFLVRCQLLAGEQVVGVGDVELEVLYKGRFSDAGLPGAPPA